MPSPFPGMDPYFEGTWAFHELHNQYVAQFHRMLAKALPKGPPRRYVARLDSEVELREASAQERGVMRRPDIDLIERRGAGSTGAGSAKSAAVLAAPRYTAVLPSVVEKEWWNVRVLELTPAGERVVTHLEVLSPSNKGSDRAGYLAKRDRILRSDVSLIEIDLLRGGRRMPMGDEVATPMCAVVSRPQDRDRSGLWEIGLRDALPIIPVPLLSPDDDIQLDLQAAFATTYEETGYDPERADIYGRRPSPPLPPDDLAWAEACLAAAARAV